MPTCSCSRVASRSSSREHQRVLDLVAGMAPARRPHVHIITNGTIWNRAVERILDLHNPSLTISIDGVTRTTFESIRVGADFGAVMANVETVFGR